MKSIVTAALIASAVLVSTPALANLDLAKKSNCLACHTVDKVLVGPAYRDVAKKYAGKKDAEAHLFERVKKGTAATGGQVWKDLPSKGAIPMPPNVLVSDADIKTLVKWILDGAK